MRKTLAVTLIGAAALTTAPSTLAGTPKAEPGAWKITVTVTRNGRSDAPRTDTICLTKDQVQSLSTKLSEPRGSPGEKCLRTSFNETDSTLDWKYQCTGEFSMDTDGSIKFDSPTHYTGTMKITGTIMGHSIDSSSAMEGTRIGDCTGKEGAPAGQH
jgi:uncharacterized protein DUF3617